MGIYALIILLRLVCVAAGSRPPMGTAGTAAFLASRAALFMAVNLSGVRVSHTVPGDSCGSGFVYEIALEIRLFLSHRKTLRGTAVLWVLRCRSCSGHPVVRGMMPVAIHAIFPFILHDLPVRQALSMSSFHSVASSGQRPVFISAFPVPRTVHSRCLVDAAKGHMETYSG